MTIRPEVADHEAVRHVNRLVFGQDIEVRLVDALRDGGLLRVSLVAEEDGRVVGHTLLSDLPITTEAGMVPNLALAPVCRPAGVPEAGRRLFAGPGRPGVCRALVACLGFQATITPGVGETSNRQISQVLIPASDCGSQSRDHLFAGAFTGGWS